MELWLNRTATGLTPADDAGREYLRKIKLGSMVKAGVVKPRSLPFHRRFFAMLRVVYQSCGDWASERELLNELKFRTGYVDKQKIVDRETGEVMAEIVTPQSIAFHEMDDEEFRTFTDKCINVICTQMVPGLEDDVLREEILRAVG